MPFEINLTGKTALITGVTSGIGAAIAAMYAKANANIAGCALEAKDASSAQAFRQQMYELSGKYPLYVQTDVTMLDQLENFVQKTVTHFGSIDILASNAGANVFRGAATCSPSDWQYNLDLNLTSHWHIARLCKPWLEQSGQGVIVFNASCHAFSTLSGSFPYNIAKTGLTALVQSLTIEWGPNIRVVGVAPGFIDTRLNIEYFNTFPDPAQERQNTINKFPLKRLGTPEEIGAWFVFLSSDYAAFAGGQVYLVDGGRSAVMFD